MIDAHPCKPEDIARAIAFLVSIGKHAHAELFRAMNRGEIALSLTFNPKAPLSKALGKRQNEPLLVVIGADNEKPLAGDRWRCARGAISWARAVVVHAAGAEPSQYQAVIGLARLYNRALLIETNTAHARSWIEMVPLGKPGFIVWPQGNVHPAPEPRSAMQ